MKNNHGVIICITAVFVLILAITKPSTVNAGGYFITDKDGNIVSESPETSVSIGPTDKAIFFYDYNKTRVFDIQWDAGEKTLIIKGNHVHLKIYNSGKIEKWSTYRDTQSEQYPLIIQPVIPIFPRE
jgi:hypothetical protein